MRAVIEIESKSPETIAKSIKPDSEGGSKFDVVMKAEKGKLVMTFESDSISGLLAGINSYLRLVRVSKEATEI